MDFANISCKWCKIFFYLPIPTCGARALLWFVLFYTYMDNRSNYFVCCYSSRLFRVCPPLRSNVLLRCHCYYEFIFGNPLYWGRLGEVNMRRVRCRQPYFNSLLLLTFFDSFCSSCAKRGSFIISAPNRQGQSFRS